MMGLGVVVSTLAALIPAFFSQGNVPDTQVPTGFFSLLLGGVIVMRLMGLGVRLWLKVQAAKMSQVEKR
jgi:hypothetical protein